MARIGSVGYLNARPLGDEIDMNRHTLTLGHPAAIARLLRDGEVDVALIPVAAALSDADYRIVPGVCVGADGPVGSVLLVAETPVEQWTKVLLDGVSRTSAVLAELLLRHAPTFTERVRKDLVIEKADPDSALGRARGTVAALVIGDLAREVPARFAVRLDLALLWKSWTGLPFVFAVWAGRPDVAPEVVQHLSAAGRKGVARIPEKYAGKDLAYLTQNLRYALDDAALTGLRRFGALAHRAGLLPREDLELYGPPSRRLARPAVDWMLSRLLDGGALPVAELATLWTHAAVAELFAAADLVRRATFPGDEVPYRVELVGPGRAAEAEALGATRVLLEDADAAAIGPLAAGGFEVALPWATRLDLAEAWAAGARVLVDTEGAPADRLRADPWPVVASRLRRARELGFRLEAGIAVGRGETPEELAAWLLQLRERGELLSAVRVWAVDAPGTYGEAANTATDHLRAVTLARLVLPPSVHLSASPETEGLGMGQASLRAGCDHAGAVRLEGDAAAWPERVAELEHHVREAGYRPARERRAG
jgi:chorismate dehydratase